MTNYFVKLIIESIITAMQFKSTVLQSLLVLTNFEENQHQSFGLAAILMFFILLVLDSDFEY
jgi:hypothetical protein